MAGKGESHIQDEQLLQRIQKGDEHAIRILIEKYKFYVFKIILGVVKDHGLAEDIAQETFIKMIDALPSYRSQGFKTWISRIAINKAIDVKRKQARQREDLQDETLFKQTFQTESTEIEWFSKAKIERIHRMLDELPENYREVVKAFYLEDKTYQEIAEEFQLEPKNVEMRLYRARKWMKTNWKEEDFT